MREGSAFGVSHWEPSLGGEQSGDIGVHGQRAYFRTPGKASRNKRLRNFPEARFAPCTWLGRPTGFFGLCVLQLANLAEFPVQGLGCAGAGVEPPTAGLIRSTWPTQANLQLRRESRGPLGH